MHFLTIHSLRMTPIHKLFLGIVLGIHSAAAAASELSWFSLDAGGGRVANGRYQIQGSIGQPDAFVSARAPLQLSGGYWPGVDSVVAVQEPILRIQLQDLSVLLAWPTDFIGFQLQSSPSLAFGPWSEVATAPQVVGGEEQVIEPIGDGPRFYRLIKTD